jgi:hypothetical protein
MSGDRGAVRDYYISRVLEQTLSIGFGSYRFRVGIV